MLMGSDELQVFRRKYTFISLIHKGARYPRAVKDIAVESIHGFVDIKVSLRHGLDGIP